MDIFLYTECPVTTALPFKGVNFRDNLETNNKNPNTRVSWQQFPSYKRLKERSFLRIKLYVNYTESNEQ